ncbi:26S proteasome non-ATPase regulatory subunit 10-like [Saccostrea echinata]|uniref:26S proteasome non-ATPase regulatory subunit 10-like n=1 Tax=Saccostrea echinata TaxID=191078 RepID=UPI002A81D454|nr:26S proteasome non-ATPase regulatory subunit 10-like [Saccostrea echinata]
MAVNTHVLSAMKKRDVERASMLLLTPGYDVNTVSKSGTPLIYAAKMGLIPVIEKLINLGANVNCLDKDKRTVLHHACQRGPKEIIQVLIKAGCDMYKANSDGDLPIHVAATSGHTESMEELLKAGMDINALNTITEHTSLELSVCYEQVHMVEFLLERKAKLEIPMRKTMAESALHQASQMGNVALIETLLKYGADINKMNTSGETPFITAVTDNKLTSMKTLIQANCDMNKYRYTSPLSLACLGNKHKIIRYLLSEGYNVSADESFKEILTVRLEETAPLLLELIHYKCANPSTLKEACRFKLRRILGRRLTEAVPNLSLPKILMEWVVSDFIY